MSDVAESRPLSEGSPPADNPDPPLNDSKSKVVGYITKRINNIERHYHEFLSEFTYLQSGGILNEYESWRRSMPQDLMYALCSGHLDADDLNKIGSFISGQLPMYEIFPVAMDINQADEQDADDSDEDFDRIVDESAIPVLVRKEMETLKRVADFKRLGIWSRDSSDPVPTLTNLAPSQEPARPKDHMDFLFAEMRWLADDFKKERHWKKMAAKRLAYAAAKVHKEKAERSQKAEKEEILRIRKQCSLISRMVRDWWRQMDKIVQTKQKARLSARHQQAMSTHLGHVIETTERYTMWLTEGIIGSKQNDQDAASKDKDAVKEENVATSDAAIESDAEFVAEVDSTDDEETIAKEEELVQQDERAKDEEAKEIEALCAEAEKSIDELLPPGYLEHIQHLHESGKLDMEIDGNESEEEKDAKEKQSRKRPLENMTDIEADQAPLSKRSRNDRDFTADGEDSADDETTIAEQEAHEKVKAEGGSSEDEDNGPSAGEVKEVSQLASEAEIPIEELLARYGLDPDQLRKPVADGETSDTTSATDSGSESGSAESSTGKESSSSEEKVSGDSSSEEENEDSDVEMEEPGLVDLLSEDEKENLTRSNNSMPENAELKAITDVAMSAQPTGNTLASVAEPVKTPFLLSGTLREYQVVGLSWLVAIYEKRLNGILADEMGLGKTIQTIAFLAHLACELGIWGPHLIVVPNSVILNWEVEFKKWCPGFKILTYFGSVKERRAKRKGWTKTNAFHVCITSYRLAIQDSSAFKRKKWKYLILDEAQNIKNFKSQRWQTLLTFNSQRRLLLTGTPLQNSLMELWSLMHFLMPNIFQSHREFQEWFASPLTGMIEGNSEYNEQLVMRLHKVLRPFLLRRLKEDVERQMPKKYEHIILCRLSKRQRYLYDDFMSLSTTKDTLASGQFLSVMNILMQLRKVCNHPNLFEPRPITSPFHISDDDAACIEVPRLVAQVSTPFLSAFQPASAFTVASTLDWLDRAGAAARLIGQTANLAEMARDLPAFVAQRIHQLQVKADLITVLDSTEASDRVSRERDLFTDLRKQKGLEPDEPTSKRRPVPIFIPHSTVLEVNEELSRSMEDYYPLRTKLPYPNLPRPKCKGTSFIEVARRLDPWDNGIPKAVLRRREIERQHRISLISRLNMRRCEDIYDHSGTFDRTSLPSPDLVYFLTSAVIRQPHHRALSRFGTGAWIACQQALRTWPDKRACDDVDGPPTYLRHPTEVVSGLSVPGQQAALVERLQPFYGPEAAFRVRSSWNKALRQMLFSPVDCFEYFDVHLNSFLITTPPAISSGVRLHTSCAAVHRTEMQQASFVEATLKPYLDSAGLFKHCTVTTTPSTNKKSVTTTAAVSKIRCSCRNLTFRSWLMPAQLHRVGNSHAFQFPDPRLIQYDCGKLQRLDLLLRELYADEHRVLIFTQMARMLDILEQFLAYHGYRYLRLDGSTKVEQRQVLMERFNMDPKIFIFILSTRSGGLGVNLTGADTVIFYDSDWNPTMDAQAQDRCHRIGQTRDVHIYRLISERTVEENILRKANQKRLLSDVAIEGGKFTTAFFKQSIISDLFAEPSGLQDLIQDKEKETVKDKMEEDEKEEQNPPSPPLLTTRSGRQIRWKGATSILVNAKQQSAEEESTAGAVKQAAITDSQWVAALDACEDDENDRVAAKRALDEAKADLEEFDESKPIEVPAVIDGEDKAELADDQAPPTIEGSMSDPLARFAKMRQQEAATASKTTEAENVTSTVLDDNTPEASVERELAEFEAMLRPIERFGVNHLESFHDDTLNLELVQFEAQIEESKKEWKLNALKALHEADEERAELEEDEILYCDPDYDPEAARLAELDELARAEEMEELLGRTGGLRGRGRGRGRGTASRGRGRGIGRGRGRPGVDSERSSLQDDGRDVDDEDEYAEDDEDAASPTDRAAWFNARYRDMDNRRRRGRFESPDYIDWDDEDGDEPEAIDIWYPGRSSLRGAKRGRGGAVSRGSGRGRGRPRLSDYWRSPDEDDPYSRQRRRFPSAEPVDDSGSASVDSFPGKRRRGRPPLSFNSSRRPNYIPPRPQPRVQPAIVQRPHTSRQYYQHFENPNSLMTAPGISFASSSGSLDVSNHNSIYHLQHQGSRILQHNSRVLNTFMTSNNSNDAVFRQPSMISHEEEIITQQYQPSVSLYRSSRGQPIHRPSGSGVAFIDSRPRVRQTFFQQPVITQSIPSTNIAPPRQYIPSATHQQSANPVLLQQEPTVPLQSFTNGVHTVQPLRSVLSAPSNHPVLVVTREVKTPTGQVFQQQFTQPVQPSPKYLQVIRRILPDGSGQPTVVVAPTSVPPPTNPISSPSQTLQISSTTPSTANSTAVQPGRKIIKVIRSSVPNAIRILPPKPPSPKPS
nr:helicase [Hymenolepis microstoma]